MTCTSRNPDGRRRILFIAETVTLAHAARPAVLAAGLDPLQYDVHLAWDPRYATLFPELSCAQHAIRSIPSSQFLDALANGTPVYDVQTLRSYVREDSRVIAEVQPDAIVGDFRLSLAVSARLAKVPYIAISNAYWSPYARQTFPMPELPLLRFTGVTFGNVLFRAARPLAFAMHCRPLNRVCREYGVPGPGYDLRRVYTEADYVLYADLPELTPIYAAPGNHRYIGPILWQPRVSLPDWWDSIPADRPVIYVTLGSSGDAKILPEVFKAIADLPLTAMVATAGRYATKDTPDNVLTADYLPGSLAAELASLVICNGGSPTTYQALAASTPVLGIASNMDQHLNMQGVRCYGVGQLLRSGTVSEASLREAICRMIDTASYHESAYTVSQRISSTQTAAQFAAFMDETLQLHSPRKECLR